MPIKKLETQLPSFHDASLKVLGCPYSFCVPEIYNKINELIDFINTREQDRSDQIARMIDRVNKLETQMCRCIDYLNEQENRLKSIENAIKPKEEESPLPCPFCKDDIFNIDDNLEGYMWVSCMNCEAGGPPRKTKQKAVFAWNSRK